MRGVVFTELIEFVEEALGFEVSDKMLENAKLENEGVFSQGGNYPFDYLVKILGSLSEITGKSVYELQHIFGKHLFTKLVSIYGKDIKAEVKDVLVFIDSVEEYVHVEVKKLYPDADLPSFETIEKSDRHMVLIYKSDKKLEAFAKGLIEGASEYFNQPLKIDHEVISTAPYEVRFLIEKL